MFKLCVKFEQNQTIRCRVIDVPVRSGLLSLLILCVRKVDLVAVIMDAGGTF